MITARLKFKRQVPVSNPADSPGAHVRSVYQRLAARSGNMDMKSWRLLETPGPALAEHVVLKHSLVSFRENSGGLNPNTNGIFKQKIAAKIVLPFVSLIPHLATTDIDALGAHVALPFLVGFLFRWRSSRSADWPTGKMRRTCAWYTASHCMPSPSCIAC